MQGDQDYLKPTEVAKRMSISRDQVLALINAGRLRAMNVSVNDRRRFWRIKPEWIDEFESDRVNRKPDDIKRRRRRSGKVPITTNYLGLGNSHS